MENAISLGLSVIPNCCHCFGIVSLFKVKSSSIIVLIDHCCRFSSQNTCNPGIIKKQMYFSRNYWGKSGYVIANHAPKQSKQFHSAFKTKYRISLFSMYLGTLIKLVISKVKKIE